MRDAARRCVSYHFGERIRLASASRQYHRPPGLRRLIETHVPFARLEDATIPVHVVATDLQGLAVAFSRGPVVEAILASAAILGDFPPVQIDGRTLMDGAIASHASAVCTGTQLANSSCPSDR